MAESDHFRIREGRATDCSELACLRYSLWPESSVEEHAEELSGILTGKLLGKFRLHVLVAETCDGKLVGFAEAGLRSHAEGCDPSQEVGYLEGWFVTEDYRRKGIGAALLGAAEDWARGRGCKEMASDAGIENEISQCAQEALGFTIAGRSVNYRKAL